MNQTIQQRMNDSVAIIMNVLREGRIGACRKMRYLPGVIHLEIEGIPVTVSFSHCNNGKTFQAAVRATACKRPVVIKENDSLILHHGKVVLAIRKAVDEASRLGTEEVQRLQAEQRDTALRLAGQDLIISKSKILDKINKRILFHDFSGEASNPNCSIIVEGLTGNEQRQLLAILAEIFPA